MVSRAQWSQGSESYKSRKAGLVPVKTNWHVLKLSAHTPRRLRKGPIFTEHSSSGRGLRPGFGAGGSLGSSRDVTFSC